jgi:3-(methylsulfanyl)propanoyl-CoA dehydrogenase
MSEYIAPVKDILFTMKAVAGLHEIAALPGFGDATDEMVDVIVEEAGKFSAGVIAPLNSVGDQQGSQVIDAEVKPAEGFKEAYAQLVEAGWISLPGNPDFGGQGLPFLVASGVNETMMSASLGFVLVSMLSQGAISALNHHGSDQLKSLYLPKLTSGEWTGTMNLTESQAGSDLGAVKTRAEPQGDHYLISGTKIFITWGDHDMTENIVHLVLARTPDAPAGSGGLSLFVVPKYLVNDDGSLGARNDVYPVSVEHKLGIHGSPTCILSFGDNGGAVGYLVGELNKGLKAMFTMMNHARMDVALQGVGVSERAYQHAVAYAKERVQGGGNTIIQYPDVRRMLMHMRSATEAARALCYMAHAQNDISHHATDEATAKAARARADLLTPLAKGWSTDIANEITSLGIQVHGGMGYIEETGAAQYYRDARILAIYEGTNGIQALDLIRRKFTRDGGKMMAALLADMNDTEQALQQAGEPLADIGKNFADGVATLKTAADWVLQRSDQPEVLDSVAFDFLMLSSYVTASWLMSTKALAANQEILAGNSDVDFYQTKLATAGFFNSNLLPRAQSHWLAMQAGSAPMMALSEDQF